MTSTEYNIWKEFGNVAQEATDYIRECVSGPDITPSECLTVLKTACEILLCRAYDSMLTYTKEKTGFPAVEVGIHQGYEYLYNLYSEEIAMQCGPYFENIDEFRYFGKIEISIWAGDDVETFDSFESLAARIITSPSWFYSDRMTIRRKDTSMKEYITFDSSDQKSWR